MVVWRPEEPGSRRHGHSRSPASRFRPLDWPTAVATGLLRPRRDTSPIRRMVFASCKHDGHVNISCTSSTISTRPSPSSVVPATPLMPAQQALHGLQHDVHALAQPVDLNSADLSCRRHNDDLRLASDRVSRGRVPSVSARSIKRNRSVAQHERRPDTDRDDLVAVDDGRFHDTIERQPEYLTGHFHGHHPGHHQAERQNQSDDGPNSGSAFAA